MSMSTDLWIAAIGAMIVGLGAGYLGAFMVLRRMALVGDALSHVALPGIAVALLAGIHPFIGAFAALAGAVLMIWLLERRTLLPSETIVGIIFTLSLAAGLLLTPEPELLEALFGDISRVTPVMAAAAVAAVLAVVTLVGWQRKALVMGIISPDLARSSGANPDRANLWFLLAVALIVALGIAVAGTLLTGALVIIPAAAARNVSRSLSRFMFLSGLFGALCGLTGALAAAWLAVPPGPVIILAGGLLFIVTVFLKR